MNVVCSLNTSHGFLVFKESLSSRRAMRTREYTGRSLPLQIVWKMLDAFDDEKLSYQLIFLHLSTSCTYNQRVDSSQVMTSWISLPQYHHQLSVDNLHTSPRPKPELLPFHYAGGQGRRS